MGSAQLFEAQDETLRLVAHHGFGSRFVDYFATVGGPATSCGIAARYLRPVFVDNVLTSPVFAGAERDELLRAGVWAVASLPVAQCESGRTNGTESPLMRSSGSLPYSYNR